MTFESAQTNYEGQQGWNDLQLEVPLERVRGKSRQRRVITPIGTLQAPVATPVSRPPLPVKDGVSGPPPVLHSAPPMARTATSSHAEPNAEPGAPAIGDIKILLSELVKRPSNLGDAEKQLLAAKVEQSLPALGAEPLALIYSVLKGEKSQSKRLVSYALSHNNVGSWTVPLRRLIDMQT